MECHCHEITFTSAIQLHSALKQFSLHLQRHREELLHIKLFPLLPRKLAALAKKLKILHCNHRDDGEEALGVRGELKFS